MRDSAGRLVGAPLQKGGCFCLLHLVLFSTNPAHAEEAVIAYIDLETNSLDPIGGRIVEIAAVVHGGRGTRNI